MAAGGVKSCTIEATVAKQQSVWYLIICDQGKCRLLLSLFVSLLALGLCMYVCTKIITIQSIINLADLGVVEKTLVPYLCRPLVKELCFPVLVSGYQSRKDTKVWTEVEGAYNAPLSDSTFGQSCGARNVLELVAKRHSWKFVRSIGQGITMLRIRTS